MAEPIVFLPDVLCDARLFGPQLAELSSDYGVMTMPLGEGERISDLAEKVLALGPKRMALVGTGLGGLVAMEIMRRAPASLSRLALIATSPLQESPFASIDYEPMLIAARTGRLAEIVPTLTGVSAEDGELLALLQDMAQAVGVERFVAQVRALQRRRDMQAVLRKCACPAVVICGADDTLTPPKRHQIMAEFIPDAEFCVIEGAAHVPTLQAPAQVTAALRQWMAQPLVLRS
ncbi:alpha/beta fold hydrolase [Cognatishimia sp. 1_MG-2023]|uniref:alpha/beta fold hydrolase n=1 Tax=Cognatishimia sp. 1_MG-2023 TaxID=3062642 RepID=UPI0026E23241|nr:alpha/beta fold hydrolase [Cognatishimia sp. 1_MG-2023]MDO6726446.1 alpha/beta fold hydrolase [Cognatishimia sp. 1_MG-2023]